MLKLLGQPLVQSLRAMKAESVAAAGVGGGESPAEFGYRRLQVLLQREGWQVNHKRIYRLYVEEKLSLRRKGGRKRSTVRQSLAARSNGVVPPWSKLRVPISSVKCCVHGIGSPQGSNLQVKI